MSGLDRSAASRGTVVVLNRDLMFGSQIVNGLRPLGFTVRFARDTPAFLAQVVESPDVALGIVDMNLPIDWDGVRSFVAGAGPRPPLLAFGPHVDVSGRRAAKAAGIDRIVSNGEFHRGLTALVERYARRPPPEPAL